MQKYRNILSMLVAKYPIPNLSAQSSSADISKFFAAYFEERLRDSPEFATNVGRHEYDDRWSDFSKAGRDKRREHMEKALATVEKFAAAQASLSEQDQLSVKLMRYDLRTQLDSGENPLQLDPRRRKPACAIICCRRIASKC